MKLQELCEGVEPKLPGAPAGVKVMSMDQFLASSGEEEVDEATGNPGMPHHFTSVQSGIEVWYKGRYCGLTTGRVLGSDQRVEFEPDRSEFPNDQGRLLTFPYNEISLHKRGVTEDAVQTPDVDQILEYLTSAYLNIHTHGNDWYSGEGMSTVTRIYNSLRDDLKAGDYNAFSDTYERALMKYPDASVELFDAMFEEAGLEYDATIEEFLAKCSEHAIDEGNVVDFPKKHPYELMTDCPKCGGQLQGGRDEKGRLKLCMPCMALYRAPNQHGDDHLNRIRKLSGLDEATALPAQQRDFGGQEFQDYMKRIVGAPDLDKQGNVKVDKKGFDKYVSGKTKGDKYKMPYIHRSSVVEYLGTDGRTYDENKVKQTLSIRPKALLKQNEKMKHSNGEFEQFFNIGFAALTGIALDEQTNNLIIVNTCPGAGSCKVDCFAMKGGKVQFKNAWQSDGRILTYLLNDPEGFKAQLMSEIKAEYDEGVAGDKKFPKGWAVTVRWHDAGDFFSPEYLDLAFDIAKAFPGVKFYAYTKMAGAALANKPTNFIINWSEGANTQQEKQVKAQDPGLTQTKNSRIVPEKLFYDLLKKDEKGNLEKTSAGAWQPRDAEALQELKVRLGKAYQISPHSILSYDEWMRKNHGSGMMWNVIVAPGEGDVSANSHDVLSTLLLRH